MDIRTKKWEILCNEEELAKVALRLGEQISKDYENKKLLVISILKGAMFFTSDLTKNIKILNKNLSNHSGFFIKKNFENQSPKNLN